MLSTILFISSLDIAGLCGKAENSDVFYWKGETIRAINERLGEPKHVAADGTIAAVACLSHLEVSFPPIHPSQKKSKLIAAVRIWWGPQKVLKYTQMPWT